MVLSYGFLFSAPVLNALNFITFPPFYLKTKINQIYFWYLTGEWLLETYCFRLSISETKEFQFSHGLIILE